MRSTEFEYADFDYSHADRVSKRSWRIRAVRGLVRSFVRSRNRDIVRDDTQAAVRT